MAAATGTALLALARLYGDSRIVRLEHAAALFRLLGGGFPGDLTGLPNSQLAILPGITYGTIVFAGADRLLPLIEAFLGAPLPAAP